jgi:hypothetical protein
MSFPEVKVTDEGQLNPIRDHGSMFGVLTLKPKITVQF